MAIEVGQTWRTRGGVVTTVVAAESQMMPTPFRCDNNRWYDEEGLHCGPDRQIDLVELVDDVQVVTSPSTPSAPALLDAAAGHMRDRAATYDSPGGERSMGATVAAFNIITGRDLSESEGWLLMQTLKDVRDRQRKQPHKDSLEDGIAYSALKAEARLKEGVL